MAEFQRTADENLAGEKGKNLRKQRSIQVEGAFGVIKQDFKFTRFSRRGIRGVKMEFLLVCLGHNLKKYYIYWLLKKRNQPAGGQYN
ncbi:MAG: transposase [Erysipelotrichaceae bacterium]|nr:transposase [Erysipelotrichaceae bacterium]